MSENLLSDISFSSLELVPELLQGISDAGFSACTKIQAATLPLALAGRDVAGQAQTGTGKTAAYLVATFQHLLVHEPSANRRHNQPRAVILAPTRELAVQIHRDATVIGAHTGLRLGLVFGGTDYEKQRRELQEGVDVLIATPGRLIDYFKQHVFDLRAIQVVVIDEADRMFDLGFIRDIRFVLRRMPSPTHRLGLLFSATLSYRVTELAYEHMNNPEAVRSEPEKITADRIEETCYLTANEEKIPLLIGLLRKLAPSRAIVFVNTKRAAETVWGFLEGNGFHSGLLSGDVAQKKRLRLFTDFHKGTLPILVATDVASRGLHIPDVSHVFNYDLPEDAQDYVHRVGRTARAGASGVAVSFACETFSFSLPEIENFIGRSLPSKPVDPELLAEVDPRSRVPVERRRGRPEREISRPAGEPRRRRPRAVAAGPKDSSSPDPTSPAAEERAAPKPKRRRRRRTRDTGSPSAVSGAPASKEHEPGDD